MRSSLPRNFFMIYFANMFVGLAVSMFFIFILLSLWYDSHSALVASVPFILMSAVPAFFSPIIGTHVDKYSKRKIGILSLLLSIISLVPLIFVQNIFIIVIVFSFILFFESYFSINYTVSVRAIVGDEKLMHANNLWVVSIGLTYLVAYSLGSYLYAYMSFFTSLALMFAFYFVALVLFAFTRIPDIKNRSETGKYREVFSVLRGKKELVYLILIYDVAFFFVVLTKSPAYIPYFFNVLSMSSVQYGIFNGLTTSLFVAVPLILHRLIKTTRIKDYAYVSVLGDGLVTLAIAAIPFVFMSFIFRVSALFLVILVNVVFSTLEMDSFMTIFQRAVPPEILGRFYSVRSIFRGAINISAYIVGGYLVDVFGPIVMLLVAGVFALVLVIPVKRIVARVVG